MRGTTVAKVSVDIEDEQMSENNIIPLKHGWILIVPGKESSAGIYFETEEDAENAAKLYQQDNIESSGEN